MYPTFFPNSSRFISTPIPSKISFTTTSNTKTPSHSVGFLRAKRETCQEKGQECTATQPCCNDMNCFNYESGHYAGRSNKASGFMNFINKIANAITPILSKIPLIGDSIAPVVDSVTGVCSIVSVFIFCVSFFSFIFLSYSYLFFGILFIFSSNFLYSLMFIVFFCFVFLLFLT